MGRPNKAITQLCKENNVNATTPYYWQRLGKIDLANFTEKEFVELAQNWNSKAMDTAKSEDTLEIETEELMIPFDKIREASKHLINEAIDAGDISASTYLTAFLNLIVQE